MKIDTFRKRAMGKVAADVFLAEHRDFLCGFKSILPVLALLEQKVILPTPALHQILTLISLEKDPTDFPSGKTSEVIDMVTGEITNVVAKVTAPVRKKGEPKRYQLYLFEKTLGGGENCTAQYEEDLYTEVMKVANRKLFQNENSVYIDVIGDGISTRINRIDAMRELLNHGPGGKAATKKTAKTSAGLGWRCSAKNFVAKFSRG